jgi:hypothetical protein
VASVSADVRPYSGPVPRILALSEKSPYLGGAWVRLDLWQSISLTGGNLETIESRAIGDE